MRKSNLLLRKLAIDKKEYTTAEELKKYCKTINTNYETTIRHLLSRKHAIRIFKGIFYIKTPQETKYHTQKYSHLELVTKGLELKGVKNWYFGLHTALKLNNLIHEYFTIDNVINDKLLRSNPIKIAGYKFKFSKLAPKLLEFGIIKNNTYPYSDPEKTILDFIYTWRYNGVSKERIVMDISDWAKDTSKEKIKTYAVNYPKTVQEIVDLMLVSM
ncbi:MAG: hypothetical protein LBB87_03790, partial [Nitrososphaerota archaeon]|nr:hypothetical protein [Nitrososphaerota archaeon]